MLIGQRQIIDPCISDLIFVGDVVALILNKELEIRIKEDINQGSLNASSLNLGIPVYLCFIIFFKNCSPFVFIFIDGFSAEKKILKQF